MALGVAEKMLLYRNMVRGRKFDDALVELFAKGHLPGMWHSGLGEEAVEAGAASFLRQDDWLQITHRGITAGLAKGLDGQKWMAEHLGRISGYAKGKGGHFCGDRAHGLLPQTLTIGGCFPIVAGAGVASKRLGRGQVVVCLFGDGAAQRGTLHECMNLASVWQLPVVWVCENNQYSITTGVRQAIAANNIADLAASYRMPGVCVDGMDVLAVAQAISEAVDRARRGDGPSLVECKTYRYREHGEGDIPTPYRTRAEVISWKERDPILHLHRHLLAEGVTSGAELEAIEQEATEEAAHAAQLALKAAWPDKAEAHTDLYAL